MNSLNSRSASVASSSVMGPASASAFAFIAVMAAVPSNSVPISLGLRAYWDVMLKKAMTATNARTAAMETCETRLESTFLSSYLMRLPTVHSFPVFDCVLSHFRFRP